MTADAGKDVEKEDHCWWDRKLIQPLWKSVWWFLRKLHIVLPENSSIPLLGLYPKDSSIYNKYTCSIIFIPALFITARSWKEPRCPATEEMDTENAVHFISLTYRVIPDRSGRLQMCNFSGVPDNRGRKAFFS